MKAGLLLLNLGTPQSPTPDAVGTYLSEFLMDPLVIDIPAPLRWILVKALIIPKRKHTSSEAYRTIWTSRGSPLLFHLEDLTKSVRHKLGPAWTVEPGMRYGKPSIYSALEKLKNAEVDSLVVLPLYPQYAESSTRSSIEKVNEDLRALGWAPRIQIIRSFHDDPGHIAAWTQLVREHLAASNDRIESHLLFSYHGLPERHLKKSDPSGSYCLDGGRATNKESATRKYDCCARACAVQAQAHQLRGQAQAHQLRGQAQALETCYRAQSLDTTLRIVRELGLRDDQWSMSFQSRLGRTPWIKPYTDEVIPNLVKQGVKSLTIVTPSFAADCLETIEEIGDRAKSMFLEAGGERFSRIECLNSRPSWVQAVADLARKHQPGV